MEYLIDPNRSDTGGGERGSDLYLYIYILARFFIWPNALSTDLLKVFVGRPVFSAVTLDIEDENE